MAAMTVRELIEELQKQKPDLVVKVYTVCHGCEGFVNRVMEDERGIVYIEGPKRDS